MTQTRSALMLMTVGIALSACAPELTASAPGGRTQISGVVCPPAGTVAVRDDGSRLRYAGADPSDPAVCLVRTGMTTTRMLGGLMATQPVNDADRRAGLASLYPLAIGRTATVRYRLVNPRVIGQTFPFEETFRVTGEASVTLEDGATRQAWVVQGRNRNLNDGQGVFDTTYQIDKETGVILNQVTTSMTGAPASGVPVRVTSLSMANR
ncbi:hypothetical protein [Muricoccus radiodurans]|uniref:hypothetical protein n=1 Tax=Muricoccus radiodurans TaxID=2231721 RepID=UPI003CF6D69C